MVVFVSALDWGLGHATRILPIIHKYHSANNKVIIGASARQAVIYQEFFPDIEILSFNSFSPKYAARKDQLWQAFLSIPKFAFSILIEHHQLKKIVKEYKVDLVISDNRYGLFSSKARSIFVGHQITIKLPASISWLKGIVNLINLGLINRFDECWIPDVEGPESLSGDLSRASQKLKIPIKYMGIQSRFSLVKATQLEEVPDLLVLISGPEKQRTVFEDLMIQALQKRDESLRYLIVRGLPENKGNMLPNSINHGNSETLKALIQQSKYIICRSGYSTLMDLKYLQRSALLVPTPGQTEQEYLADLHSKNGSFKMIRQEGISISSLRRLLNVVTL